VKANFVWMFMSGVDIARGARLGRGEGRELAPKAEASFQWKSRRGIGPEANDEVAACGPATQGVQKGSERADLENAETHKQG
jgi:hypothetical protein